MIDKDPRDLIERMCACLHGWSALWGPPANSPTRILVDEARRYLAQPEPQGPTDEELYELWNSEGIEADFQDCRRFARAVWRLARWGTPANTINQVH